jgi:hypothetical protein
MDPASKPAIFLFFIVCLAVVACCFVVLEPLEVFGGFGEGFGNRYFRRSDYGHILLSFLPCYPVILIVNCRLLGQLVSWLVIIIIIMKSSFDRDNKYCHYVIQRIAGFAITLYYHPAAGLSCN